MIKLYPTITEMSRNDLQLHRFYTNHNLQAVLLVDSCMTSKFWAPEKGQIKNLQLDLSFHFFLLVELTNVTGLARSIYNISSRSLVKTQSGKEGLENIFACALHADHYLSSFAYTILSASLGGPLLTWVNELYTQQREAMWYCRKDASLESEKLKFQLIWYQPQTMTMATFHTSS